VLGNSASGAYPIGLALMPFCRHRAACGMVERPWAGGCAAEFAGACNGNAPDRLPARSADMVLPVAAADRCCLLPLQPGLVAAQSRPDPVARPLARPLAD